MQVSDWLGGWRPSSDPHVRVAASSKGYWRVAGSQIHGVALSNTYWIT